MVLIRSWSAVGKVSSAHVEYTRASILVLPVGGGGLEVGEGLTLSLSCLCGVVPATVSPHTVWQFSSCPGSEISFSPTCRVERIEQNATNTFLVYTEEDLGDLLKIQLTWEGASQSWYNLWKELRSYLSQPHNPRRELNIRRIRVKSGETQRK